MIDETSQGIEETSEGVEEERTQYGQVQRRLRELCGLSCAQLAETTGLSWSSVSRYESRGSNVRFPSEPALEEVFKAFSAHPACAIWLTPKLLRSSAEAVEEALTNHMASVRKLSSRRRARG